MRGLLAMIVMFLVAGTPAAAAAPQSDEFTTSESVLRWIDDYRLKPDPANLPAAVKVLSRLGAFRDPENAAVHVGFLAGVLSANPEMADDLVARTLPLPAESQWVIVRAIAYSGLPGWKDMLTRFADRLPARQAMIDKYVAGKLPTLDQVARGTKPSWMAQVRGYVTGAAPAKEVGLDPGPEYLDLLWGYYFATGNYRPISHIIAMLPWSRETDDADKLTVGSMAKYTLAMNAVRHADLLAMLKRAVKHQPKDVVRPLDEVIEAADTVDTTRLRKQAMAAIETLKTKGPDFRRNVSLLGKIGEGTLSVGCIVAAATGHVELGLPCVIGGGLTSSALHVWDSQ